MNIYKELRKHGLSKSQQKRIAKRYQRFNKVGDHITVENWVSNPNWVLIINNISGEINAYNMRKNLLK